MNEKHKPSKADKPTSRLEEKRSAYREAFAERREQRRRKGRNRMLLLVGLLLLLIIAFFLLPDPPSELDTEADLVAPTTTEKAVADSESLFLIPAEDLAPNPLLEGYVDQELRPEMYRFTVTYPNKEGELTKQEDGRHLFRIAGTVHAGEQGMEHPFQLHLFSNQAEDYEQFDPIFTEPLSFQVEGDHYTFQLSRPQELTPGLYYYLINEANSGEAYYVGKVMVGG